MRRATTAPAARLALFCLAALMLGSAGCCGRSNGEAARLLRQEQARPEILFGAVPLEVGAEDLGYFAAVEIRRDGIVPFDFESSYLERRVYDVQSTRHPFSSGHRTRTYSVEQRISLEPR